jgi:hypothetical protein
MILLADPHPFIVQETVYPSDAATRAKSQTSALSRARTQINLLSLFLMSAGRNFSSAFVAHLVRGIV